MTKNQQAVPANGAPHTWTVRHGDRDDFAEVARVVGLALLADETPESMLERMRPLHDAEGYDRVLYAVDDREGRDEVVGSANHFPYEMTLPGGPRAVAGVTGVGVWPTHRRQGVLSSLMRRQLSEIHESGGRYAALWASEGAIYGRFGYGLSAVEASLTVHRRHAVLRADAPRDPNLRLTLSDPGSVRADLERVHREVAAVQLGQFQRSEAWWDKQLRDGPKQRGDQSPLMAVVVHAAHAPLGYALYRTKAAWAPDGSQGEVHVLEFTATTPTARVALLDHLFNRDLTARVTFHELPADTSIPHLLVDPERARITPQNSLWVRLVDVPAGLRERTYKAPFETVLEVTDRYAPWNAGRWRVKADTDGARVEATEAATDLTLDASHLGAAYLGQIPLTGYLNAGLITEHTPGTVERLDTALHRIDAPFCGLVF